MQSAKQIHYFEVKVVKDKDISSTDKLLGLIRKKSSKIPPSPPASATEAGTRRHDAQLSSTEKSRLWPIRKKDILAVDLSGHALKMTRMSKVSGVWNLVKSRRIPITSAKDSNDPSFIAFLKRVLSDFAGRPSGVRVWSSVSTARTEIWHFKAPKVKKGLANAIFWSAKKEKSFDEKEFIFDYRITGEVIDAGLRKYQVCAYIVPRDEYRNMVELFNRAGYPLEGLTVTTFAFQNLFEEKIIPRTENPFAVLYIDQDATRIDIFESLALQFSRVIKTGTQSLVESIIIEMEENSGRTDLTGPDTLADISEQHNQNSLSNEQAYNFLCSMIGEEAECPDTDKMELITPVLQRLSRQVERTLDHYVNVLENRTVDTVYLAGEPTGIKGFREFMSEQLGIKVERLDPLHPALPLNTSRVSLNTFERLELSLATALAMSDSAHTNNLLFTSKDMDEQRLASRISRFTAVACMFLVVSAGGYSWVENQNTDILSSQAASLEGRLNEFEPLLTQEIIREISLRLENRNELLKELVNKNLGLAVLGELADTAPANIHLLNVHFQPRQRGQDGSLGMVTAEGFIRGSPDMFETSLSRYVYNLRGSLLFSDATVHRSFNEEMYGEGEVRRFVINIRLPETG